MTGSFRILALTKYGSEAASTRQRLLQFAPYLNHHGITIDPHPLLDDNYVRALAQGKRASRQAVILNYLKRLARVVTARRYDLLWVHFEAFPYAPGFFEKLLSLSGRPVVVDFDDAIFHMYDNHQSPVVRRLLGRKLVPLLRDAAAITVGNSYLRNYVKGFNAAVTIIPTVVDTTRYVPQQAADPQKGEARPLVVGWIGSPSTWPYVERMLPALLPVIRNAGAVLRVVGAGPAADRWPELDRVAWSEATEITAVQQMDIGIMPLPDEDWARGKCGYKLIQYMACGLPTIASPVGVNADIVVDGETGLLATTATEWQRALTQLVNDQQLRRALGEAGRTRAVQNYSLASQEPRLLSVLKGALQRGAAAAKPLG